MEKKSNNQRLNAKNPNNPAYKASMDNRSRQLNSENPTHDKSRSKK